MTMSFFYKIIKNQEIQHSIPTKEKILVKLTKTVKEIQLLEVKATPLE